MTGIELAALLGLGAAGAGAAGAGAGAGALGAGLGAGAGAGLGAGAGAAGAGLGPGAGMLGAAAPVAATGVAPPASSAPLAALGKSLPAASSAAAPSFWPAGASTIDKALLMGHLGSMAGSAFQREPPRGPGAPSLAQAGPSHTPTNASQMQLLSNMMAQRRGAGPRFSR